MGKQKTQQFFVILFLCDRIRMCKREKYPIPVVCSRTIVLLLLDFEKSCFSKLIHETSPRSLLVWIEHEDGGEREREERRIVCPAQDCVSERK